MGLPERLDNSDFGIFGYYHNNSIKVIDAGGNLNTVKQFILLPIK